MLSFPPLSMLRFLTAIEELELNCSHTYATMGSSHVVDVSGLVQMRRLIITADDWDPALPSMLRRLSASHALRDVAMRLLEPNFGSQVVDRLAKAQAFLTNLAAGLAGLLSPTAASGGPNSTAAGAPAAAATASEPSISGLDEDESAAASSSAPALLESLRLDIKWQPAADAVFPLADLLRLPRLRSLEVRSAHPFPLDLTVLASASTPLPALTSLSLTMDGIVVSSLPSLSRLVHLRKLQLITSNTVYLPSGCLRQWATQLTQLQVLLLHSIQLAEGELAGLASMTSIRALSITNQTWTQPDLSVLSQLPALQELQLGDIRGLALLKRNWMDDIGRPDETEATKETDEQEDATMEPAAAATPPVAAASTFAAPSLAASLSSCRFLRVFRWAIAPDAFDASVSYTASRSWWKGRVTKEERQRRLDTEHARERHALRQIMQQQRQRQQSEAEADGSTCSLPPPLHFEISQLMDGVDRVFRPLQVLKLADTQKEKEENEQMEEEKESTSAAAPAASASASTVSLAPSAGVDLALWDAAMLAEERELEAKWAVEAQCEEEKRASKKAAAAAAAAAKKQLKSKSNK